MAFERRETPSIVAVLFDELYCCAAYCAMEVLGFVFAMAEWAPPAPRF